MKKSAPVILIFLFFFVSGCSLFNGSNGDAYIAYSWVSGPISFYSEDPSFGDTIYNGVYEDASVGTWYFEYIAWDDSWWYGVYTVYENEGAFMTDGEDIYFELSCLSFGPSFYEWSPDFAYRSLDTEQSGPADEEAKANELGTELTVSPSVGTGSEPLFDHDQTYEHKETITKGNYTIVLEYSQIK